MNDQTPRKGARIKVIKTCCRNCSYWQIQDAQTRSGKIYKDRMARCNWKMPEGFKWPASMRFHNAPKLYAGHMSSEDGQDCGTFSVRAVSV